MEKIILIKYGELTTKSGNRHLFINQLANNIKRYLKDYEIVIKKDRVRMFIIADNKYIVEIVLKLQNVFGIHGIVIANKVNNNCEEIQEVVIKILREMDLGGYSTFKVKTKRAFKGFSVNSMEFNNVIGGLVLKNFNLKVDVHKPDLKINIEIREKYTYIYFNEMEGSKGYPVGVQGKGLLLLSGGIDSPVAGYLALKRGIDIECLYFESLPHTSIMARNKVIKLASIINKYSLNIKLHVVPFTKIQEAIYKKVNPKYSITIMRRMMFRMATKYLEKCNCKVIITGENVGQVASQTLDSMIVINDVTKIPIIRPLVCFDKLEIIDLAIKIKTYETSILPYEDCCTIFLPKYPIINPILNKCLEYEKNFDFDLLIEEAIANIKVIKLDNDNYSDLL